MLPDVRREGLVILTLVLSGCTSLLPGDECNGCDAGANDASANDAGASDAGAFDAGAMDAGRFDGGAMDAGRSDAGFDGGRIDAGSDGGMDAGSIDAGSDAGMMDAGTPLSVIRASAGGDHTCAIEAGTNDVLCWGANGDGQLGGTNPADVFVRVDLASRTDLVAVEVCTGAAFTCVLMNNRVDVWCWGANGVGQLGRAGGSAPAPISWTEWIPSAGEPIHHLYCGAAHACVLTNDYQLACWGNNGSRQSDPTSGAPNPLVPPRRVLTDVHDAALGLAHTCVIADYFTGGVPNILILRGVRCWGSNVDGQATAPAGGGFTEISAGLAYSCAGSATSLECWGGATEPVVSARPTTAPVAMEGGARHGCGLHRTITDRFVCWGLNDTSQLGTDATVAVHEATLAAGDPVVGISAGRAHGCAWARSGSLWCWGWNFYGQVDPSGSGSTSAITSPWRVSR